MSQMLTWKEIEARHTGEWVELVNYDWPEGTPYPIKGEVRVHAVNRKEFYRLAKGNAPYDSAILFVGKIATSRGAVLSSNMMKIEVVDKVRSKF